MIKQFIREETKECINEQQLGFLSGRMGSLFIFIWCFGLSTLQMCYEKEFSDGIDWKTYDG